MILRSSHSLSVARGVEVFLLLSLSPLPGTAKIIMRRDPLDAALDSTVIVIMQEQSEDKFEVEEVFLGDVVKGQILVLPAFRLIVEDRSSFISGVERVEPIYSNTRILVFLKPQPEAHAEGQERPHWVVAGYGNCYFWSHDPSNLESLRVMAKKALALRTSWETARQLAYEQQRAEALWPYLWNYNHSCYKQTETALQGLGAVAGDYIAGQLEHMSYQEKGALLVHAGTYSSVRLHDALVRELKSQQRLWEELLYRRKGFAAYDEIDPPGRMHYNPRRTEDAEADEASDIYGVLYYGLTGLESFHDRNDLPFFREAALWSVKYRFKQLGDAALHAFAEMPDRANLAIIESIWKEYSTRQFGGNELHPYDIIRTLTAHKFPETIPLMAQFVKSGFMQEEARQFLVQITGTDLGSDTKSWTAWYESHKRELGLRN
jgi:hypothetical protein